MSFVTPKAVSVVICTGPRRRDGKPCFLSSPVRSVHAVIAAMSACFNGKVELPGG